MSIQSRTPSQLGLHIAFNEGLPSIIQVWMRIHFGDVYTITSIVSFPFLLEKVKVLFAQSCLTLCDPMDCSLWPWNSPGKNTGVGSHSLLQGIFPTQGSNPGLLHCSQILYHLSKPLQYSWVSLVAQSVKNLAAMQETWVQSLGWEDPLQNLMDRGA